MIGKSHPTVDVTTPLPPLPRNNLPRGKYCAKAAAIQPSWLTEGKIA